MPALLIGHITKDGAIAGPKSLEHIVDTVIYFEGEKGHSYRILRAIKNRFGSTPEIGVFEMLPKGLVGVENPSDIFLSERPTDSPRFDHCVKYGGKSAFTGRSSSLGDVFLLNRHASTYVSWV